MGPALRADASVDDAQRVDARPCCIYANSIQQADMPVVGDAFVAYGTAKPLCDLWADLKAFCMDMWTHIHIKRFRCTLACLAQMSNADSDDATACATPACVGNRKMPAWRCQNNQCAIGREHKGSHICATHEQRIGTLLRLLLRPANGPGVSRGNRDDVGSVNLVGGDQRGI